MHKKKKKLFFTISDPLHLSSSTTLLHHQSITLTLLLPRPSPPLLLLIQSRSNLHLTSFRFVLFDLLPFNSLPTVFLLFFYFQFSTNFSIKFQFPFNMHGFIVGLNEPGSSDLGPPTTMKKEFLFEIWRGVVRIRGVVLFLNSDSGWVIGRSIVFLNLAGNPMVVLVRRLSATLAMVWTE